MSSTIEFEALTEQEALDKACQALSVTQDRLDYTVIDEGSQGLFGLGARPVRIRVRTSMEVGAGENMSETESPAGIIGPAPEKAAQALEVARGLAEKMGVAADISVRDEDDRIVVVMNEEEGSSAVADVLGKSRPPAIPSFQFLLNKIVNRFPENRKHILLEVPSVPRRTERPNRRDAPRKAPSEPDPDLDPTLVALARVLAEKARSTGKVICIHPMLPADRRAVHQTLMNLEGVHTVSSGEGLYRRMHIVPNGVAPKKSSRRRRRRRSGPRREGEGQQATSEAPNAEATEEAPATEDRAPGTA